MRKTPLCLLTGILAFTAAGCSHAPLALPQKIPSDSSSLTARSEITLSEAIAEVRRLPKVQAWLQLFPNGISSLGGKPVIALDSESETVFSIHAYELLPDHTASFNYYTVDKNTGTITPTF